MAPTNAQTALAATPAPVDYDALAKQSGSISSTPVDYDSLAKQSGAISSAPASQSDTDQSKVSVNLPRYGNRVQNWTPSSVNEGEKQMGVLGGSLVGGEVLPAAGVLLRPLLVGTGAALGNSAGQAMGGNNPVRPDNLKESAKTGAIVGGTELGTGLILSTLGKIASWFHPGVSGEAPAAATFQPALRNTPNEVVQHAADEGINLTPAQATQDATRKAIQSTGEKALIGGDNLHDAMQTEVGKLNDSVQEFQRRLDPKMQGTSPESAGEAIQQSAQKLKDATHEAASQAYKNLPADLQATPVDVSGIQQEWAKDAAKMKTVLQNTPASIAGPLQSALNMGVRLGTPGADGVVSPFLTFSDAAQMRSIARELGETHSADLPARYQGLFKKLSSDIDAAMEQSADNMGHADEWRDANEGWKNYVTKYGDKSSPLYKILRTSDPAKITDLIKNASAADIQTLVNEGVDLGPIKNQVVTDIARNGYKVTNTGLGSYDDGFLTQLLGPAAKKELYLKSELGRRMLVDLNPSGTSKVGLNAAQIVAPKLAAGMGMAAKTSLPRPAEEFLDNAIKAHTGSTMADAATTAAARAIAPTVGVETIDQ